MSFSYPQCLIHHFDLRSEVSRLEECVWYRTQKVCSSPAKFGIWKLTYSICDVPCMNHSTGMSLLITKEHCLNISHVSFWLNRLLPMFVISHLATTYYMYIVVLVQISEPILKYLNKIETKCNSHIMRNINAFLEANMDFKITVTNRQIQIWKHYLYSSGFRSDVSVSSRIHQPLILSQYSCNDDCSRWRMSSMTLFVEIHIDTLDWINQIRRLRIYCSKPKQCVQRR